MAADNSLWIVAITALVGPLATLLITNFYKDKQQTKDQNYSLQAIWFTKKLNAAEVITAHYSLLLGSLFNSYIFLVKFRLTGEPGEVENSDPSDAVIIGDHLTEEGKKGMDKASNLDPVLANSLFLYFQIPEERNTEMQNIAKSFYESYNQIGSIYIKAIQSKIGSKERADHNEEIEKFITKYDRLKSLIEATLKQIRDSFSVYDL